MPEQTLRAFLQQHLPAAPEVRRLVVALSGGLDSRVLLHAAAKVAHEFDMALRALHVHHGLSANADAWVLQAQQFCEQEGVPLVVTRVQVAATASVEGAARTARHAAFQAMLGEGEALLLAQHRDDQAETVLFRLLRGAGVTGLGAMRPDRLLVRPDGAYRRLWRPFLNLPRAVLLRYAQDEQLCWVDDESNADTRYARNFLRHEILPRLRTRWPGVDETLVATARRLQEADALLQEFAAGMAEECIDDDLRIELPAFCRLSPARQRLLLRYWLQQQGFLMPEEAVLARIQGDVIAARADAGPVVAWAGCEVRRFRDRLYALPPPSPLPTGWSEAWQPVAALRLPDGRWIMADSDKARRGSWQLRYRQGGERYRPGAGCASRELKTVFQEAGIPPWQRERLLLVCREDEVVAVPELNLPGQDDELVFRVMAAPPAQ